MREDVVELLEWFVIQTQSKGAQPLISFAPIAESAYDEGLTIRIASALHEMPLVGSPNDFRYPDESFYDTRHHLRFDARARYVDRLAELLEAQGVGGSVSR